jgi:5-methylcytosine-specific restriction endonuclease McrA
MATIDALRDLLWARDEGMCGICKRPVGRAEMEIDHAQARGDGGLDDVANLRPAHGLCNRRRAEGHRRGAAHPHWGWRSTRAKFLLRLPTDLREAYQDIADREHRTLTNLIIHALREWVAKQKP